MNLYTTYVATEIEHTLSASPLTTSIPRSSAGPHWFKEVTYTLYSTVRAAEGRDWLVS